MKKYNHTVTLSFQMFFYIVRADPIRAHPIQADPTRNMKPKLLELRPPETVIRRTRTKKIFLIWITVVHRYHPIDHAVLNRPKIGYIFSSAYHKIYNIIPKPFHTKKKNPKIRKSVRKSKKKKKLKKISKIPKIFGKKKF